MRERPDLEQLKRQARELLNSFANGNATAAAEINAHYDMADSRADTAGNGTPLASRCEQCECRSLRAIRHHRRRSIYKRKLMRSRQPAEIAAR
jgi:hypothetical protein